MRRGGAMLFYESVMTKVVVGVAEVTKESLLDATVKEGDGSAVELNAVSLLSLPVTLEQIKTTQSLAEIMLVRQGRLSVMPLTSVVILLLGSSGRSKGTASLC